MSLFKDISTDVIKLFCWILFFIVLFLIAGTSFYYLDYYVNLDKNTKLIQECIAEGNSEVSCKSRVY